MSKIKIKKQIKKQRRQQRKNEFGFVKTKQLDEIEGSDQGYFLDSSPFLAKKHEKVEEVLVVNDDKKELVQEKPRFSELSTISVSQLVQSDQTINIPDEDQEELGFFFDSTPSIEKPKPQPKEKKKKTPKNKKQEQKQKIIQDDSVFIELTDDDDDDDDDHLSVSSSEDIEIIKSLAHWSRQDDMNQLEIDSFKKRRRRSLDAMDYHLLESMSIQDILEDNTHDDLLLTEELDFEQELVNVPSGLIQNYKGLIREEKNRYNQERRYIQRKKMKDEDADHTTILEEIIHEFIERQDIESYDFKHLTAHGRNIVIPKIAKLFQLKTIELDTNFIKLEKTVNTCIPTSFKYYLNQQQQQLKKKKKSNKTTSTRQRINEVDHGKQVAIGSAPISSNNIGHRMLSAMGWKEGDTIGNTEDGIKEPIKVFMRAKRRGLGA